jgi:hypothetical protein
MAQLSDKQRRLVCRLLFSLVCLLPTCLTAYLLVHRMTAKDWARIIKAETRLGLQFNEIETPTPSRLRLQNVRFTNPGLEEIPEISAVEIAFAETNTVRIPGTLRLPASALRVFIDSLRQQVLPKTRIEQIWEIRIDKLEISGNSPAQTSEFFGPVVIGLGSDSQGKFISNMSLGYGKNKSPCEFELACDRGTGQEGIYLLTGENSIPLWLINECLPVDWPKVTRGRFEGEIQMKSLPSGLAGKLRGKLNDLDLLELSSDYELSASGRGELELHACRIDQGKISYAEGLFHAATNQPVSATGLEILGALLDQPELSPALNEVSMQFEVERSMVQLHLRAKTRDSVPYSAPPFRLKMQHAIHLLTSPNFLHEKSEMRSDIASLTDEGVSLLKAFQLDDREQVAAGTDESLKR